MADGRSAERGVELTRVARATADRQQQHHHHHQQQQQQQPPPPPPQRSLKLFASLPEADQVYYLTTLPNPQEVNLTPVPGSDRAGSEVVVHLLRYNAWYRGLIVILSLLAFALGVVVTMRIMVLIRLRMWCEQPVNASGAPMFTTQQEACPYQYCNRQECCGCTDTTLPSSICESSSSFMVCGEVLFQLQCNHSSQCVREHLAEADFPFLVQHWIGVDIANLVVLGLLLVDLSGRAAVLAKGLCVCYCRNPLAADSKKHSPCCRSCRRCEEQGSRQHSPRSAEQKPSVYSGARVSSP